MRDVRKIGRRTWLAVAAGGAVALWTSLRLSGRDGWVISLGTPGAARSVATNEREPDQSDIHRVRLGPNDFTTSYIVVRGSEAAIVDTGVYDSHRRIGEVMQAAGLDWDAVHHLILTHHHNDHVGSVRDILRMATTATVWAGAADIPQINANKEIKAAEDGAEIFGLRVIATPGHTLGHISIYDEAASTFISGDAINTRSGSLALTPPQNTANMTQAVESAKKIAALGFEKALFMHGDPIDRGAAAEIGRLAASLPNDAAMLARLFSPEDACCPV
jgi:glyoxylase-like metal-dependent hydrolase (beta-lactamase superfamily II)